MDAVTFYTIFVCAGLGSHCSTPHGLTPSLTRQHCLEEMWMIRALDHSKRVICLRPDPLGGDIPDDVIDSAGGLRPEFPLAPSDR